LQGERKNVGELLGLMKAGSSGSMVSGIEMAEIKCKDFQEFKIEY